MSLESLKASKSNQLGDDLYNIDQDFRNADNLTEVQNEEARKERYRKQAEAMFNRFFEWLNENKFEIKTQVVGGSSAGVHGEVASKKHGLEFE